MANAYDVKGLVVLITGGNGQLGRGLIERFLEQGAVVHSGDLQDKVNADIAAFVAKKKLGKKFTYHQLDVTKEEAIREVFKKLPLDVLVNNAGVGVFTIFEERTEAEIDLVMDVNIKGTILCTKVAAEIMAKKGGGRIINIGSMYGVVPPDKRIYGDSGRNNPEIYGATKAGVIQMTRYWGAYLADRNIRVNAVSPGGIFNNQKEFFLKNYIDKTPVGRMASTDDIANAVLFLSTPETEYITGQNLSVDGGFTLNQ